MATEVVIAFLGTFVFMEWAAWACHKYVMHGFLWSLHEDHHVVDRDKVLQKNDFFAVFFAVPSFLLILTNHLYQVPVAGAIGFGIMAYGFVYFLVHEVVIHRRLKWLKIPSNKYFRGLNAAHKIHHSVQTKEGASNFGMLVVDLKYFKKKSS